MSSLSTGRLIAACAVALVLTEITNGFGAPAWAIVPVFYIAYMLLLIYFTLEA